VMEADADLYLVKPFSYPELVARVKAILRRYRRQEAPTYQNGAIIFLINLPVR